MEPWRVKNLSVYKLVLNSNLSVLPVFNVSNDVTVTAFIYYVT